MDERIKYIDLYDYYSELLTDKQREYFEDYYFNNLTLAEISENENISRNAVHKQVKEVEKKLFYYEEKLKLKDKSDKIKEIIKDIDINVQNEIKELI